MFQNVAKDLRHVHAQAKNAWRIGQRILATAALIATLALSASAQNTAPPVLTSSLAPAGVTGTPFSYLLTADNGPWTANIMQGAPPPGLTFNSSSKTITGTPTAAGSYDVQFDASNDYGETFWRITISISPNTPYNINAIYTTGTAFTGSGLDNSGNAYVSSELGASAFFNGSTFTFGGANVLDGFSNITVPLPSGTYPFLNMVGTAAGGIAAAQTFTVNYSDGSSQPFTFNMHDWRNSSLYSGETKVVSMTDIIGRNGALISAASFLHGYTLALNGKSVQSITLPAARGVIMLGFAPYTPLPVVTSSQTASGATGSAFSYQITATNSPTSYNATSLPSGLSVNTSTGAISGTPAIQGVYTSTITATNSYGTTGVILTITIANPATAYNVSAIYTAGTHFTTGGLDSYGNAYLSSQLGTSTVFNGSMFTFGPANAADGWTNTTVNLAPGTYTSLDMVGTSSGGIASSQTFTVNYTDGTAQPFTISMKDWTATSVFTGETKVSTMANYAHSDGTGPAGNHVLHGYTLTLNGKSVKSITLPAARGVVILGFKGH